MLQYITNDIAKEFLPMDIEKRIDEIMAKMSLHEKVEMCHGNSKFASAGDRKSVV